MAVDATPAEIFAMAKRFLAGRIALTFAFTTFLRRGLNDFAVDATPTLTRRRRCRRWTMNWRRTRKRIFPTWRIFRRTRRMGTGRAVPFVTTTTFFPPPAAAILNPSPLTTLIMPLPAGHTLRRELKGMLVTVLGDAVADDNQRIADCSRDGEDFKICLRQIAEIVEIVHFVFDKKERVLGIVGRRGGANDHALSIRAITGNAVRGAGITAECSQIGNGESRLSVKSEQSATEGGDDCKTDFSLHVYGSVVVARLRPTKKASDGQEQKSLLWRANFSVRRF